MKIIYEPRGRAREFALLAANLYRGCSHGCAYCYVPQTIKEKRDVFSTKPRPRRDVLKSLEKDARKYRGDDREILLNFTSDPYQPPDMDLGLTRQTIEILIENGLRFTILTKGGKLNYKQPDRPVNWVRFREEARTLLDSLGADYYIKNSLTELQGIFPTKIHKDK